MNTQFINLTSNYIYLAISIYLAINKFYIYSALAFIIWLVSHIYHTDTHNSFWSISDTITASIGFIFVMIRCYDKVLCIQNIILLILLLCIFATSLYYYKTNMETYDIIHSVWHIFSGVFLLYLLLQKENEK